MIFASAVLWLLAAPQEGKPVGDALWKPVTYSTVAARLENVLPELAEEAGVKMEAGGDMKEEVVVVRVRDVTLKDLMAKLAEVCHGDWVQEDGIYRLSRPQESLRKMVQADTKRVESLLQKQAELVAEELSGIRPVNATLADLVAADSLREAREVLSRPREMGASKIPDWTDWAHNHLNPDLAKRAFLSFSTAELAAFRYGDRIVYASNPTRMQRSLPFRASAFLRDFATQRGILARAEARVRSRPQPALGLGKARIVVTRYQRLTIEVCLFDAEGARIATSTYECPIEHTNPIPKTGDAAKTPVRYSETTRRYLDAIRSTGKRAGTPGVISFDLPQDLWEQVLKPEAVDPLSTQPTDEVLSLAEELGPKNVVAVVPDELLDLRKASAKRRTVGEVWIDLVAVMDMNVACHGDWFTVDYEWPSARTRRRTPRAAVAALYSAFRREDGILRLNAAADFAVACVGLERDTLGVMPLAYPDMQLLYGLSFDGLHGSNNIVSRQALALYGMLSDEQKRTLIAGAGISIRSLTPRQRQPLIVGAFSFPDTALVGSGGARDPITTVAEGEPTEFIPDGVPLDGIITLSGTRSEGLFPTDGLSMSYWTPLNVAQQMVGRRGDSDGWMPTRFREAQTVNYRLRVEVRDGWGLEWAMADRWWAPGSRARPLVELPRAFQDEVQRHLDAIRGSSGSMQVLYW